jgi:3-oxoacyl-[acyl-carrier-protein] synthase II
MSIVISGWSAVSSYGQGRAAFTEGVRTRPRPDFEVPDFSPREALGRKGTRSMDRVTGFAVSTVGMLLAEAGTGPGETGLILGTTTGSAESMMEFTRSALEGELPYHVDPARFPNTVMNCAAGQCAIWHDLKGPNTTLAGGYAIGLHALTVARRLLATGRAQRVLCGGVEEFSAARTALESHATGAAAPLGEGCVVHFVEEMHHVSPDRRVLAEVLTVETGVAADGDLGSALRSRVGRALSEVDAGDVWAVAPCGARGVPGLREAEVLDALLPDVTRIPVAERFGDLSAASGAFQLAAVLAAAEHDPTAAGKVAVVTAVEHTGAVACGLLRLAAAPSVEGSA